MDLPDTEEVIETQEEQKYPPSTPLHEAVLAGNESLVRSLLESKSNDINCYLNNGTSPLECAIEEGHVEIVSLLLDYKANLQFQSVHGNALLLASENNEIEIIQIILKKRPEWDINNLDRDTRQTPLHAASYQGHLDVVKLLYENKANLENPTPRYKMTPLLEATSQGNYLVTKFLIEQKAQINVTGGFHLRSPLHFCYKK